MRTLLVLLMWFGIFCFVTEKTNPMEWSTTAKVWSVIIGLVVIGNYRD